MTRDGPETPGAGDRCTVEEQRWRWERKRECTARELLQTERIYVDELELITKFYDEVFRARCDHLKISDRGICGAIPEIVKVHRVLLSHLEAGSASLGFEALSQSLCLYKRHADSIEPTLLILETKSKKNKSFARFKKLQESRPELHGRCLEQLLQLPLQRVTQYKHFLRDLMENSLPRSRDTSRLSHAFAVVCDVCQHMENISNHQENYRQLQRVQKMLKGRTLCVLTPGRWYIREGWLSLVPQSGEEVKHRMLFLFSDIIAVTSQCHPLHPTSAHKFACRAVYPLKECRVERILGHTQSQGGLLSVGIITHHPQTPTSQLNPCILFLVSFENEKVMLMSSDQEDINDWYNCLVTAVRKAQPHCEHQEKNRTEQKAQKRTRGLELRDIPSTVKSLSSHDVSPKRVKISAERPPVSPSPASPPTHSAGWSCVLL